MCQKDPSFTREKHLCISFIKQMQEVISRHLENHKAGEFGIYVASMWL